MSPTQQENSNIPPAMRAIVSMLAAKGEEESEIDISDSESDTSENDMSELVSDDASITSSKTYASDTSTEIDLDEFENTSVDI